MVHKWHNIGAGRVGDSYKGGKIVEIDHKNARAKVAKAKALKIKKEEGTRFHKEVRETPYGKVAFLKGETLNKARRGRFGEAGAINNSIWRKTHRMRQKSGEAGKWIPYRRD